MRELLILFGALIGWVLGYVFRLYAPGKVKEEEPERQQELTEAKDTIRHLEAQIGQYQNLQEQLKACENQRQQKTKELESVQAKFTSAEEQIETLQQRLEAQLSQEQTLQEQLKACETQRQHQIEELENVNAKLTSSQEQIDTLRQHIASLEQQIQTAPPSPPVETPLQVEEEIPQAVELETSPEKVPPAVEAAAAQEEETPSATKAETEAEPETDRSTVKEPDKLRKLEGIGPKVEQLLNESGILTFAQLAQTEVNRLRAILEEAGGVFKAMDPASWPEQAALAAKGDWDALKTLQDQLDGGRYKS